MDGKRKEKTKSTHSVKGLGDALRASARIDSDMSGADLAMKATLVAIGFLFSSTHTVFGAYPLGLALVSALPSGVWLALFGSAVGSLTLGKVGIVYALCCLISVMLRAIVSASREEDGKGLFSENISQRLSAALLGSSVAAAYELIFTGIAARTLLFAASNVSLCVIATFGICGLFGHGLGVKDLILGTRPFLFLEDGNKKSAILFKLSALFFILLISLSIKRFDIFGVNLGFVFSGAVTMLAALRFGSVYGAVVGFASSVAISGAYSVSFLLGGAAAGLVAPFGKHLAAAVFCAIGSLWGAYASGTLGFLSVFPESLISAVAILPILRYIERERAPECLDTDKRRATDMVGTMALAYRNRSFIASEELEVSLKRLIPSVLSYLGPGASLEDMSIFLRLLEDEREARLPEREMDGELTDRLEAVLYEFGLGEGVIRAFGKERKHIILAAKDKDGTAITSPALKHRLEGICSLKLGKYDYYRREDMALMECESLPSYKLRRGSASVRGGEEVSGDTVAIFEARGLGSAILLSDGMGSGEEAKMASAFVSEIFSSALAFGTSPSTLIHLSNLLLRRKGNECSASLDLFIFDTVTGKGCFYKSGAASSYIKRANSLFRIKSETMPLGIMESVDAEHIGVEVALGDAVIMISDGIIGSSQEQPWLIELLNRPLPEDLDEACSLIIEEAKRQKVSTDDMTVAIAVIDNID